MKKTYYLLFIAIFMLLLTLSPSADVKVEYNEIPFAGKTIEVIATPVFFTKDERLPEGGSFRFEYKNEVCNISGYTLSCYLNGVPSIFPSKEKNAFLIKVYVYRYLDGKVSKMFVNNMDRWEHKGEVCYMLRTFEIKNFHLSCFKK